jgi:hypothetical protein
MLWAQIVLFTIMILRAPIRIDGGGVVRRSEEVHLTQPLMQEKK